MAAIERAARDLRVSLVLLAGPSRPSLFRTHIERIARDLDVAVMVLRTDKEQAAS